MKISGLQKTTLIDYPGKIACTIFLHGCNFRCGFCYNADLVIDSPKECFLEKDVFSFLENRRNTLDAVCITGGEPLLSLTEEFLKGIKDLGYLIKIDTNGSNPEKLKEFIEKGLVDYIAMDIKGARDDYALITGVDIDIEKIEESIKVISDFNDYEFRTTVLREFHDFDKLRSICEWMNKLTNKKLMRFFLQSFKNEGDFIDKKYEKYENTNEEFLNELKEIAKNYFKEVDVRW